MSSYKMIKMIENYVNLREMNVIVIFFVRKRYMLCIGCGITEILLSYL